MTLDVDQQAVLKALPRHVRITRWVIWVLAGLCVIGMLAPSWLGLQSRVPPELGLVLVSVMLMVFQAATPVKAPTYGTTYVPLIMFVVAVTFLVVQTTNDRAELERERLEVIAAVSHFCGTRDCRELALPAQSAFHRCYGISHAACEEFVRERDRHPL